MSFKNLLVYPIEDAPRVVVRIEVGAHQKYPEGIYRSLNGRRGSVIRCNERSMYGNPFDSRAYLVRLDCPVRAWWSDWSWIREQWFAPSDLRKVRG